MGAAELGCSLCILNAQTRRTVLHAKKFSDFFPGPLPVFFQWSFEQNTQRTVPVPEGSDTIQVRPWG
jgi:hypothetical protein